jgi:hypothetical protein
MLVKATPEPRCRITSTGEVWIRPTSNRSTSRSRSRPPREVPHAPRWPVHRGDAGPSHRGTLRGETSVRRRRGASRASRRSVRKCPRVRRADNKKCPFLGLFSKPSDGLEPSTPSFTMEDSGRVPSRRHALESAWITASSRVHRRRSRSPTSGGFQSDGRKVDASRSGGEAT